MRIFLLICSIFGEFVICFQGYHSPRAWRTSISMSWTFSKSQSMGGGGSLQDSGAIGSQGEYYYTQSRKASIKGPKEAVGKEFVIPIFPRNQILSALGQEVIGVYEMRFRHLLYDVGDDGLLGYVFYSPENQKFALVGTLARATVTERLADGGMYARLQGVGRFYIKEIIAEKPYLKCRVQVFYDYSENTEVVEKLEHRLFDEMRYTVKLMNVLHPQNNYNLSDDVMLYRPTIQMPGLRSVLLGNDTTELKRRTKFSFAIMDMIKTDPISKLLFLQEHVVERRYHHMLKVVEESTAFLDGELRKRNIMTEQAIKELRESVSQDFSDIGQIPSSNWNAENIQDGQWTQSPVMMD